MKGDLHGHSRMSDGSMRVEDIVAYAARIGLDVLGVTDHDSMGTVRRAERAAAGTGVRVVPGLEISAFDYERGRKVHLLCYAPPRPEALLDLCWATLEKRRQAAAESLAKIEKTYPISEEIVRPYAAENGVVYKQHIVAALMDRGFAVTMFGELWQTLFSPKTGMAPVSIAYPEVHEALRAALASGGLTVLAHPGHYRNFELVGELAGMGLEGIEVYHPLHSPDDVRKAEELAERYGLLVTGGSDFHGRNRPGATPLGMRGLSGAALETFLTALKKHGFSV